MIEWEESPPARNAAIINKELQAKITEKYRNGFPFVGDRNILRHSKFKGKIV